MQSVLMGVGQGIQIGAQQALNDVLKSRAEMRKVSSEIRGIVSQMVATARGKDDEELVSNLTKYQVSLAIPGAYEDTGSMVKGLIDTGVFADPTYQPFGAALGVVSPATPTHRATEDEIVKMGLGVAPAGKFWWISETGVPTLKGAITGTETQTRIIEDIKGRKRYVKGGELVFPDIEVEAEEEVRKIIKDKSGRQRYADTGEFVFEDVEITEKESADVINARNQIKSQAAIKGQTSEMYIQENLKLPFNPDAIDIEVGVSSRDPHVQVLINSGIYQDPNIFRTTQNLNLNTSNIPTTIDPTVEAAVDTGTVAESTGGIGVNLSAVYINPQTGNRIQFNFDLQEWQPAK